MKGHLNKYVYILISLCSILVPMHDYKIASSESLNKDTTLAHNPIPNKVIDISPNAISVDNSNNPKRIMIIQHQSLGTYRDTVFGFINSLPENRYLISKFNADNDINAMKSHVEKIVQTKDYDLILAVGTLTAIEVLKYERVKPVLISALASPQYSGMLEERDWVYRKGRNFAGADIKNQILNGIKHVYRSFPFRSIGIVYIIGEPSHEGAMHELSVAGKELGFKVFSSGIKNRDAKGIKFPAEKMKIILIEAVSDVVSHTDVFFVNVSRTYIDNFPTIYELFIKNKVLSIGDSSYIGMGLVIGITSDYFQRGEMCAEQAVKILEHGVDPGTLPMQLNTPFKIDIDLDAAKAVEFNPSAKLLLNATGIKTKME